MPARDDVIVSWNRHSIRAVHCLRYEKRGAKAVIVENGWIAPKGQKTYSILLGQHNCGSWRVGPTDRFDLLGVPLKPWRERGEHILLLPSRGIGSHEARQPYGWIDRTIAQLRAVTKRPIRIRMHPGKCDNAPALEADLVNAHAVVTWASGAAIKALAAGVPAFYGLKDWVGAAAAKHGFGEIEQPFLGDRLPMFRALAWAQYTAQEIRTGWPLKWILE